MQVLIIKFIVGFLLVFVLTAFVIEIKKKWDIVREKESQERTSYLGSL